MRTFSLPFNLSAATPNRLCSCPLPAMPLGGKRCGALERKSHTTRNRDPELLGGVVRSKP